MAGLDAVVEAADLQVSEADHRPIQWAATVAPPIHHHEADIIMEAIILPMEDIMEAPEPEEAIMVVRMAATLATWTDLHVIDIYQDPEAQWE